MAGGRRDTTCRNGLLSSIQQWGLSGAEGLHPAEAYGTLPIAKTGENVP